MKKLSPKAEKIMIERFGKDTVIALATVEVVNGNTFQKRTACRNRLFSHFTLLHRIRPILCISLGQIHFFLLRLTILEEINRNLREQCIG